MDRYDERIKTPCYIVDETRLIHNLEILKGVIESTGCKILLAQKAFSMYRLYPLIGSYLCGATASGLYEARLGAEEMCRPGKALEANDRDKGRSVYENHIFSPAYREDEFEEILEYCDHIVFNSWKQVLKFGGRAKAAGKSIGLRINPEKSTQEGHAIYDPCAPGSRLGITLQEFESREGFAGEDQYQETLGLLDGLHFHTLCEQNADDLEVTLEAVLDKFGKYLKHMKWLNFGGGHHITRPDYQLDRLKSCISRVQQEYGLEVYLEPGEAIALNAGYLVTTVLETRTSHVKLAILDTSAACHMPDVIEMPYRPPLRDSGLPEEKQYTYRFGGPTCLAGDIIGEYSFDEPLKEGDRLVFEDMAIYSMVKNNTFNGMALPDIMLYTREGELELVKRFGYEDFKGRLS